MSGLAMANAEQWAQARMVAYWTLVPNRKKGHTLKLTDIMEIPLIDGIKKAISKTIAKWNRLTPEEIDEWHAGTWVPPDERETHDNSTTT